MKHPHMAVIAFAGFAMSLLFPAIRIAPRGSIADESPPFSTGRAKERRDSE